MSRCITLSSCYNFKSGYRRILELLLSTLNFKIIPRTYTCIDKSLLKYFNKEYEYSSNLLDLSLVSLNNQLDSSNVLLNMDFSRTRILYTMWESTRVNDLLIEILNKFKCIIVPNRYNKLNFIKQGITCPIHIVPLFCDTNIYSYTKKIQVNDKFIFGISNEDYRKNLDKVTLSFLSVFKNNPNVELQIKTCESVSKKYYSPNVKYINLRLSDKELRDWYSNLDVYISGTTCEGWGMMQQESMCCGTPIICTNYGGLCEFTSEDDSYYVKYKEVYSTGYWGDYAGKWSEYDSDDMIKCMSHCIDNKDEVMYKGKIASENASKFTESRFIKSIESILEQYI
jgi:glycosyltransferase involved in cell wall biosynthesis